MRVALEPTLLKINCETSNFSLFLDPSAPCAGCASAVEVDQEIVSFALAELSYGECQLNSALWAWMVVFSKSVVLTLRR